MVVAYAVQKLALSSEPHPKPYQLAWLQKGNAITVDRHVLLNLSIGGKYS